VRRCQGRVPQVHGRDVSIEWQHYEIESAGLYLHWPYPDEDLKVEHLLRGYRSGESEASFQRWHSERAHR
jgi:hypothetical protein